MLEKNIDLLIRRYPDIKQYLTQKSNQADFQVIEAKNGSKTAVLHADNKSTLLHSKYNPEREAEKLIKKIDFNNLSVIIILGFGLGYHILRLYAEIKKRDIKVFIIETNPFLFKEALKYHDFRDVLGSDSVYLFLREKIERMELIDFIESKIDLVYERMKLCLMPSFNNYSGDNYPVIIKTMNYLFHKVSFNRSVVSTRGNTWDENLLNNLDLLLTNPGVAGLKGLGKNKPAIIVAAGPSLNKNIHLLKDVKDRTLIIAVDGALKTLLANEIIPDIVVAIDGYKYTLKYFEGINYEMLKDTILIGVPQFFNSIFKKWPGPVLLSPSYVGEKFIKWIESWSNYKGRVVTGGSVAHLAFSLACLLESDPIIFVGQDLAFTDGYTHVSGNDYIKKLDEKKMLQEKGYLEIKDINDEMIWTKSNLLHYLQWLNIQITKLKERGSKVRFIDATEGGAKIKGTEITPLKEVIGKYCQEEIRVRDEIITRAFKYVIHPNKSFRPVLRKLLDNFRKLKRLAERGLGLTQRLAEENDTNSRKTILELENIRKQVFILKDKVMLYESLIYDIYQINLLEAENSQKLSIQLHRNYQKLFSQCDKSLKIFEEYLKIK